jgi:transketolase C-terminal domain/subunit
VAEECATYAGIKETLAWELKMADYFVEGIDLGDRFVSHGDVQSLYKHYGLDGASIADRIKGVMGVEE